MSSSPELVFPQDDTYVLQPHEIEGALQELWRESLGEDEEPAVMQVRTLNLLVFVPAERITEDVRRAIEAAAVQHPGRTIAMIVSDDPQPPKAYAAIACRMDAAGKQLCGEQITITSGEGGAPLPSIAAALLGAGVPTFLWWLGDPPLASALYESFVEIADHVIVDGRTWQQPLAVLPQLADAIRREAPHIIYTDLQWTALTPWRRLTAQCFDLPDALPCLQRLDHVTIAHGPAQHDRVTAALFVGWLASRLGWTSVQRTADTLSMARDGTPIAITFEARADGTGLHEILLTCGGAAFQLEVLPGRGCIKTAIRLPDRQPIERITPLTTQTLDTLLGAELDLLDRDLGYEGALAIAAQLATAIG